MNATTNEYKMRNINNIQTPADNGTSERRMKVKQKITIFAFVN